MSRRQQSSQYNKFYHNDIKKQLGIDQTRTASQKLLDKVINVDKRPDFYHTQNQINSQPSKKIKLNTQTQQPPQTHKQILQNKLFKNIQNQININKLLKSLSILKKCLNQQTFIQDPEINFQSNWKQYTTQLINQITQRNYCSSESFNIMANIGDCIEILFNKFGKEKQFKIKQTEDINQQNVQKDLSSESGITNEQVWISFCGLFTDDSFIFNRNLNKLKKFIFTQFDGTLQTCSETKQLALKSINKLVLMPVKAEWVHTQLTKLFKEFNNNGFQNQFEDSERKLYLKNFNQLLNKKPKSSVSDGSYNMMGSSKQASGLKTVHLQSIIQNSSDKWVSKQ